MINLQEKKQFSSPWTTNFSHCFLPLRTGTTASYPHQGYLRDWFVMTDPQFVRILCWMRQKANLNLNVLNPRLRREQWSSSVFEPGLSVEHGEKFRVEQSTFFQEISYWDPSHHPAAIWLRKVGSLTGVKAIWVLPNRPSFSTAVGLYAVVHSAMKMAVMNKPVMPFFSLFRVYSYRSHFISFCFLSLSCHLCYFLCFYLCWKWIWTNTLKNCCSSPSSNQVQQLCVQSVVKNGTKI